MIRTKLFSTALHASASALTLTERCARKLRELAREEGRAIALRLAVEGGGCSGMKYAFALETRDARDLGSVGNEREIRANANDGNDIDDADAVVLVDDVSYEYVKGATIDYVEEMIKSSFEVVKNPQAEARCGCGVSFNAKNGVFS